MIRNVLSKDPRFAQASSLRYTGSGSKTESSVRDQLQQLQNQRVALMMSSSGSGSSSSQTDNEGLSQSIFGTQRSATADLSQVSIYSKKTEQQSLESPTLCSQKEVLTPFKMVKLVCASCELNPAEKLDRVQSDL